jgi:hypothetical protein
MLTSQSKSERMNNGLVKSRVWWKPHAQFGERAGETDRSKGWHRAPVRLHSRLLHGVWVRKVRFEPGRVVVALRRRRLCCPLCGYSTRRARTSGRSIRCGVTSITDATAVANATGSTRQLQKTEPTANRLDFYNRSRLLAPGSLSHKPLIARLHELNQPLGS